MTLSELAMKAFVANIIMSNIVTENKDDTHEEHEDEPAINYYEEKEEDDHINGKNQEQNVALRGILKP